MHVCVRERECECKCECVCVCVCVCMCVCELLSLAVKQIILIFVAISFFNCLFFQRVMRCSWFLNIVLHHRQHVI